MCAAGVWVTADKDGVLTVHEGTELRRAVLSASNATVCALAAGAGEEAWAGEGPSRDSPLMLACAAGRDSVLPALLVACPRAPLFAQDKSGNNALTLAVLHGHWRCVDLLLAAGAGLPPTPGLGDRLLAQAMVQRQFNTAGRLVAAGLATVSMDGLRGRVPPEVLEWVMVKQGEASRGRTCAH